MHAVVHAVLELCVAPRSASFCKAMVRFLESKVVKRYLLHKHGRGDYGRGADPQVMRRVAGLLQAMERRCEAMLQMGDGAVAGAMAGAVGGDQEVLHTWGEIRRKVKAAQAIFSR